MFTTFSVASGPRMVAKQQEDCFQPSITKSRPKRHQVSRACVWCRAYRIKCDASFPCNNCKIKGRRCNDGRGKDEVRTYPLAVKEIDKLKKRIKELEEQLDSLTVDPEVRLQDDTNLAVSLPVNLDPLREHGSNKKYYNWEFISMRTARSNQQIYGTSSSFYFIGQMSSYLDKSLQQPHSQIQLSSASRSIASPMSTERYDIVDRLMHSYSLAEEHFLSQMEEEELVVIFFDTYHSIWPIIDEDEFKTYHRSLRETPSAHRNPSALVDIVLAISLQYIAASKSSTCGISQDCDLNTGDAAIAGRWFYRRCQNLLTDELEGPSIQTFQCHLLSVLWLLNASFQNMAHSVMAIGIRTGIILGLQLEPPEDLPTSQREFRKRLWWMLYAQEMKMAMDFGRPIAVSISMVTCSLPEDNLEDVEEARYASRFQARVPNSAPFIAHCVRLILSARAIYITFYEKCAKVLGKNGHRSLYQDLQGLESCAEFLQSKVVYLQTWAKQLPNDLKTGRENGGEPLSTDRSLLQVHSSTPIWLARQRLFLELTYHDHLMSLYRPFISFSTNSTSSTPLTERHAISCVNHAITITQVIYQILTKSELLDGWHVTFQYQWNAALSLIGYILAYPVGPSTPTARKAIGTAIDTFEMLSTRCASAASAANVARDLSAKADLLTARNKDPPSLDHPASPIESFASLVAVPGHSELAEYTEDGFMANSGLWSRLPEEESTNFQNTLTSTPGFGFSLDSFGGLESIGENGGDVFDWLDFVEAGSL
ncbi:hypothetical protein CC78DRAFT_501995 [Lojkania enalia]|uniref:Zn(2)-C6 fungal-type domain-containing protein n=1 Tax=Lojkania enalia TaxID=147567 RepID=A0A9P4K3D4_9PLEO|nr:hypothetical protein CC78DRAFT_501995 [Didymosphaeria enalia]